MGVGLIEMMRIRNLRLAIFLIGLLANACSTQAPAKLFETKEILSITLVVDLEKLLNDVDSIRSYHPAILQCADKNIAIAVKTRGKLRRDPEVCDFPPLMLRFPEQGLQNSPFEGQTKLRLVSHCQSQDPLYEQFVVEEYGIYRSYNLLTDSSFRVQLLGVTYRDAKGNTKDETKIGFFIENEKQMARRLGGELVAEADTVEYFHTNTFVAAQVALFQFMVGNTDWSVSNKHNIRILRFPNLETIAIPYDFDAAGLIQAPYIEPDPDLGLNNPAQRLYRGYCGSQAELQLVFQRFKARRLAIDALWQDLPFQDPFRKQKSRQYLGDFYALMTNPDSVRHYIHQACR